MNKYWLILIILIVIGITGKIVFIPKPDQNITDVESKASSPPLAIEAMRQKDYPGSDLVIEQTLTDGSNYHQYIVSYKSEGLKIYGLLTLPMGDFGQDSGQAGISVAKVTSKKWPVIVFNHGFIPPKQYKTTERYTAYVDVFARAGYIVFKSDYRGNGSSQGQPEGAYYSPSYTEDVLNALASLKKYPGVNPNKIGMWGHSMGGNITLRSLIVRPNDIKAAVIWGGVVGTYDDLMNNWQRRVKFNPPQNELALRNRYRVDLIAKYGTPQTNPRFWQSIDPNYYLIDVAVPIQLHAGAEDEEVPSAFSQGLSDRLKGLGKNVEFYSYPGGDHNISDPNFSLAMKRSVEFFDKYLKN